MVPDMCRAVQSGKEAAMEVESEDPLVVRMGGAEFADCYLEYRIRNVTVPADAARQGLIECRARDG